MIDPCIFAVKMVQLFLVRLNVRRIKFHFNQRKSLNILIF